jgi:RHS repeat-associated protein
MKIIFSFLLILASAVCHADGGHISGSTTVQPGVTETYFVSWDYWDASYDNYANVNWSVTAGTILSSNKYSVTIQWDNTVGIFGGVSVSEDLGGQFGDLQVTIAGDPVPTISPISQTKDYSLTPDYISINFDYPPNTVSYQWQEWSFSTQSWSDISGETTASYQPPQMSVDRKYRCLVSVNGQPAQELEALVNVTPLNAGSLVLVNMPMYNSTLTVTTLNASGGFCNSSGYTYVWEMSLENGPWTVVGTGATVPSITATGNMQVRRKVTCGNETAYTNSIDIIPGYTTSDFDQDHNYVYQINVMKPGVLTWQQADQLPIGDKLQTTMFYDGLNRPIQQLEKAIVPGVYNSWNDMVTHFEYDAAGRRLKTFIPFYATYPGLFKLNAGSTQANTVQSFYNEPNAPTYVRTETDNSPLDIIQKEYKPGADWGGSGIYTQATSDVNNYSESIVQWYIDYSFSAIPYTNSSAFYPTGSLAKKITTDEKGRQTILYTDMQGKLILKRVQSGTQANATDYTNWANTYYIYNDLGRLRYILSPNAAAYLSNSGWTITQSLVDELCYVYEYDSRGRTILMKKPGVAAVYMIYDKRNRKILEQTGNMRGSNRWQFFLYDDRNRNIATGLLQKSAASLQALQNEVDQLTDATSVLTLSVGTSESVTANMPVTGLSGSTVLAYNSVVEYDDYTYAGSKTFSNTFSYAPSTNPNIVSGVKTDRMRNLVTGEKKRMIEPGGGFNTGFLNSTAFYDEKGRALQQQVDNVKSGTDIETRQYEFSGRLTSAHIAHKIAGASTFTVISQMVYDRAGRLTSISKNYNNTFYKTLASYEYDAFGQLKRRVLAPGYTGNGTNQMETLDYTYTINGWLKGINQDYAATNNTYDHWDHFFGMSLGYGAATSDFPDPQYNGSITGAVWKTQGDNSPKKYAYQYDKLNRFIAANFQRKKTPADNWTNDVNYSSSVNYADANGNISSMTCMGMVPGTATPYTVDQLQYQYNDVGSLGIKGNKLVGVTDGGSLPVNMNGLLGDFVDGANSSNDYEYDGDGNLVKDLNKNIQNGSSNGIDYNFLGKQEKIYVTGKSTVTFVYDAAGTKLSKTVTPAGGGTPHTTYYIGSFVYEDNDLKYILHEEGRVKIITTVHDQYRDNTAGNSGITLPGNKEGVFEYFIKDNLGNARMVLTEELQVEKYLATSEAATLAAEEQLFGRVEPNGSINTNNNELALTRVDKSTKIPGWTANTSAYVSELTAAQTKQKIGANMLLKVMAGDIIASDVNYYYEGYGATLNTSPSSDIASSLLNALTGFNGSSLTKNAGSNVSTALQNNSDFASFLNHNDNPPPNTQAPRAYLNVVFLDEQFNFISYDPAASTEGSQSQRVNNPNTDDWIHMNRKAPKNGWVFVYISNESNAPVYFDNLGVTQTHGRISQENHYYPHGLKIAGLSSQAMNKLVSKYGYQSNNSEEEEQTGWNEFAWRMYDPQIGRWITADPLAVSSNPYIGMGNNPVRYIDANGGEPDDPRRPTLWLRNKHTGQYEWFDNVTNYKDYVDQGYAKNYDYTPEAEGFFTATFAGQPYYYKDYNKIVALNDLPEVTLYATAKVKRKGFTLGASLDLSLGAQAGITVSEGAVQGTFGAGAYTHSLYRFERNIYDLSRVSSKGSTSFGIDPEEHNYANLLFTSPTLGNAGVAFGADYHYNTDMGHQYGPGTWNYSFGPAAPTFNTDSKAIRNTGGFVNTGATPGVGVAEQDDGTFVGLDVGAGISIVLGISVHIKIGYTF